MKKFIESRIKAARSEDGSALVIALITLTIAGLTVSAFLAQAQVNLLHTSVSRARENRDYASEAGVDWGIQQLRRNVNLCSTQGSSALIGTITVNNQKVDVSCKTTAGNVDYEANVRYALVTYDSSAANLNTQSGSNTVNISGPVYIGKGGVNLNKDVDVSNGFIAQQFASCPNSTPFNSQLRASGGLKCTVDPAPDPGISLSTLPVPSAGNPNGVADISGCRVFAPGKYTAATVPNLLGKNYFASGVYYFENADLNVPNHTDLIGGLPASGESALLPGSSDPCYKDANVPAANAGTVNGTGVVFVFGGTSRMTIGNNTNVELFSHTVGTQQVSVMAVKDNTIAGWSKSNAGSDSSCNPLSSCFLSVTNGGAGFTTHGMIYAPASNAALFASSGTVATSYGGVFVNQIQLQSSTSGTGLALSTTSAIGSPSPRTITVTAKAYNTTDRDIKQGTLSAEAVIEIANDTNLTGMNAVVKSWRTVGVS